MNPLFISMILITTLWTIAGVIAVCIAVRPSRTSCSPIRLSVLDFRRKRHRSERCRARGDPSFSVLKPLRGADPQLESNLVTFFQQDYPSYQLIFGVEDLSDPAIAVVERLRARFPRVDATLVVHEGGGSNPKVSNLRGMLPSAKNDLLVISDSNVFAPPSYLRDLAETMAHGPCLATNVFVGVGEKTMAAALENVQISGFIAAGAALPTVVGDAAVVGKSMCFSRSLFERLGGFNSVAEVLAEDFIIGKMFQHAGYPVRIAPLILQTVNGSITLQQFFDRQLRWSMMRIRLRAFAFVVEPLTSPLVMFPFACAAIGPFWAFCWMSGLILLRDAAQWWLLRGPSRIYLPILLGPMRELMLFCVWILTPFVKHTTWRGRRVRVGAGTRVYLPDLCSEEST